MYCVLKTRLIIGDQFKMVSPVRCRSVVWPIVYQDAPPHTLWRLWFSVCYRKVARSIPLVLSLPYLKARWAHPLSLNIIWISIIQYQY